MPPNQLFISFISKNTIKSVFENWAKALFPIWDSQMGWAIIYCCIFSCSFHGNYSFSNLEIGSNSNSCHNITFLLLNKLNFYCGNYSREENIQGRNLYEEIWYQFCLCDVVSLGSGFTVENVNVIEPVREIVAKTIIALNFPIQVSAKKPPNRLIEYVKDLKTW